MKTRLLFAVALLATLTPLMAQEEEAPADSAQVWTTGGSVGLTFSQVTLENWAGGGESSVSLGTVVSLSAKRETDKSTWANQLDFNFGLIRQESTDEFRKTDDQLILISEYGLKLNERWSLSFMGNARTQVADGFRYSTIDSTGEEVSDRISAFLSPGYLTLASGLQYSAGKAFTATLSPVTGKVTTVLDQSLADAGAYGVDEGENFRFELGANFFSTLDIQVVENIRFKTNLNLFAAYEHLDEIDVNLETVLAFEVNDYVDVTFGTQTIYDEDVEIVQDDGTTKPDVQFKSALAIGVGLTF